jgi:hypothetical protein
MGVLGLIKVGKLIQFNGLNQPIYSTNNKYNNMINTGRVKMSPPLQYAPFLFITVSFQPVLPAKLFTLFTLIIVKKFHLCTA